MGATEEQMAILSDLHVTHVSYILLLYSIAFLLYLFVSLLLGLYAKHAWPVTDSKNITRKKEDAIENGGAGISNGPFGEGDARMRDAEEFELEGLMSEDESAEADSLVNGRSRKETQHL